MALGTKTQDRWVEVDWGCSGSKTAAEAVRVPTMSVEEDGDCCYEGGHLISMWERVGTGTVIGNSIYIIHL
jgi:hypothetical protein